MKADPGFLARMAGKALDLLYPPVCPVCNEVQGDGKVLCLPCAASLPRMRRPFCGKCGEHFHGRIDGAFVCPNCSDLSFAFEFARPALLRDDRTLEMIHRLKYNRQIHLAKDLGKLAAEALQDERFAPALAGKWPLVPVPLHRSRQAERHFNQAAEIARSLSITSGLPLLEALERTRKTETQTHFGRVKRMENLQGAFGISKAGARWPEKAGAIIVDDVLTTGSTVDACAKTLRKAGFHSVYVITVMRG